MCYIYPPNRIQQLRNKRLIFIEYLKKIYFTVKVTKKLKQCRPTFSSKKLDCLLVYLERAILHLKLTSSELQSDRAFLITVWSLLSTISYILSPCFVMSIYIYYIAWDMTYIYLFSKTSDFLPFLAIFEPNLFSAILSAIGCKHLIG